MSADGTILSMTSGTGGMPPRQPLAMPTQELRGVARIVRDRAGPRVRLARLITFGGAAFLTGFGLYEMIQVVLVGEMTVLEGVLAGFFAITFGWISLAATSAIAGLAVPPARHRKAPDATLTTLTALLVPVYHEDPKRIAAAIEAMARDLQRLGQATGFEVVVLSDSTDADAWVCETQAFGRSRSGSRAWFRSGTGDAGRTPPRRPATSRISSRTGAAATTTCWCSTPTA